MAQKASGKKRRLNRGLVLRALTDPKFRKLLQTNPSKAIGKTATELHQREVGLLLATVKGIETHIRLVADELLCLNGPCGIA
jgi:hypothetical protein